MAKPIDSAQTPEFHTLPPSREGAVREIAFLDLESNEPLPDLDATLITPSEDGVVMGGMGHPNSEQLQLDSHILMCACPDCKAPMTINLVLLAADCWRCQTSIELTEEQKRELRRQLAREASRQAAASAPASLASTPRPHPTSPAAPRAQPSRPAPSAAATAARSAAGANGASSNAAATASKAAVAPAPPPPPPPPNPRRQRQASATTQAAAPAANATRRRVAVPRRRSLWDLPSWLVSLVFHMVLMTLLALITLPRDEDLPYITLSSEVSKVVREGGQLNAPMDEDLDLDLPIPENVDLDNPQDRKAIVKANQDARELLLDDNAPNMPNLEQVKAAVAQHGKANASLIARDPRLRVEMVKREGARR